MCVIYVCTKLLPEDSELARGACKNNDGAGLAWIHKEKGKPNIVRWMKGELKTAKDVKQYIADNKIPLPLMIHFRTASVGGPDKALAHPFPITKEANLDLSGEAEAVLMHNGTLSFWEDLVLNTALRTEGMLPEGPWSDSRALAWIASHKGASIIPFLTKSSGSRVVVLEANPPGKQHFRIWGGSQWTHKDGYSQSITTEFANRGGSWIQGVWSPGDEEDEEDACKAIKCHIPQAAEPPKTPPLPEPKKSKERSTEAVTVNLKDDEFPIDEWSLEQLRGILELMHKEMKLAETAAGV